MPPNKKKQIFVALIIVNARLSQHTDLLGFVFMDVAILVLLAIWNSNLFFNTFNFRFNHLSRLYYKEAAGVILG